MGKYVLELSGGGEGDFYEYNVVVESECKDDIEYELLSKLKDEYRITDYLFENYVIYTLDEWVVKNTVSINVL